MFRFPFKNDDGEILNGKRFEMKSNYANLLR